MRRAPARGDALGTAARDGRTSRLYLSRVAETPAKLDAIRQRVAGQVIWGEDLLLVSMVAGLVEALGT